MQTRTNWIARTLAVTTVCVAGTGALAQDKKSTAPPSEVEPAAKLPATAPLPEGSKVGLPVPAELAKKGSVYHCIPGKDRQVFFQSDAPFEKIEGQSNAVIGYTIAGPKENPAALQAGEWHLPVASMTTGIRKRDEHMRADNWLGAEKNPNIIFVLREVQSVQPVGNKTVGADTLKDSTKAYVGTLVGDLTVHGVTKSIEVPEATIMFVKGNDDTAKIAPGDLMAIRAKFHVKLSEFGVKNEVVGRKVAEELSIDTALYHSTQEPSATAGVAKTK
ncbi:MAG: YceI family protein [Phycisphaerales bacterium]|nr:YceI family protein [Phycisphaerales bacterium]